jgi:hypothetical protein
MKEGVFLYLKMKKIIFGKSIGFFGHGCIFDLYFIM